MNPICFDLEGPLSPQDNAYDLMNLIPNGDQIFEVISRYDDLLAMEGREDYEPGDTLSLIVPFLLLHDISEADIAASAARATLNDGALEIIASLKSGGWEVFCITTTYEQYAYYITKKLGIKRKNVACTKFGLDGLRKMLCKDDATLLVQAEMEILAVKDDDSAIKQMLDNFFRKLLPDTMFGQAIRHIKPVGGRRKLAALVDFSIRTNTSLPDWVVVGDSITDFRMLKEVDASDGLAIAFNANQYALPYATMSLASVNIGDLMPVLKAWQEGGRNKAKEAVKASEKTAFKDNVRKNFHWLSSGGDIYDIISLHRKLRRLVREEAGKLG
jgi:energy-converting hydrogenase A subunit R